jgi:hypothetical protein
VGGDMLDYSGNVATSTDDIVTFKKNINSTLSTEDADMMMMDIKTYYLGTALPRYVIVKIPGRNCEQKQPHCTGRRRVGLHRNQKGNVRI